MWKNLEIEGFQHYEVNDETGKIRSTTGRRAYKDIKGTITSKGYIRVCLTDKNKKEKDFFLHDLIYWTFIEFFDTAEFTVNHINEIKTDNRLINLEKMTRGENDNHGTRNERISKTKAGQNSVKVRCIETGIIYNSIKEAQETLKIENISRAIKYGNRAGGFYWEYVEN